ncbi:MAG TPA: HipA domain-containing protein [Vineibacter sp.]|nr:HipA domain-containing protein [Vineibacter sp.]
MSDSLTLVADGRVMGTVVRLGARLTLHYDATWRGQADAWPLSLSMPLVVAEHEHSRIEPWLRRLLPGDERVLRQWGRRFNVGAGDVFGLLAAVGEDCPGAVQIVPPDRLAPLLDAKSMTVDWLTRAGMADRLRALRKDHAAWRQPRDAGHCSLAGSQPKTALFFNGQHWGVPSGRTPTTHILKPLPAESAGRAYNTQLCLHLARAMGLPAAHADIVVFEDEIALAVERYDRVRENGTIRRLHQEELGQALGQTGAGKPRSLPLARVTESLRAYSAAPHEDIWRLIKALLLKWLVASPERDCGDQAILIGADGRTRLAPLHDVTSLLLDNPDAATALEVAGNSGSESPQRHWRRVAAEARLPPAQVIAIGRDMAAAVPQALRQIQLRTPPNSATHPVLTQLTHRLTRRAERCAEALAAA